MRLLPVLAIVVATSLGTVACSDGGGGAPGVTAAGFLQQANAVCTQGATDLDALLAALPAQPSDAQQQAVFPQVIANLRDRLDGIAALQVPATSKVAVTTYLDDFRTAVDRLEAAGYAALSAETDPLAAVNAEATKLGLTACATA
jgi:hypothetical protein